MNTLELTIREIKEIKLCDVESRKNSLFPLNYNPSKNMSQRIKNIVTKFQHNCESFNQAFLRILKAVS